MASCSARLQDTCLQPVPHIGFLFTADVCQPWTNYVNNGSKYLIIGAVVSSEYSNI